MATALKRWIKSRNALEKEGTLAVIICVFSDAPSQVAQEVHPCLVDCSHGLDCDRHKQVRLLLLLQILNEKALRETQTLRARRSPPIDAQNPRWL